MKKKIILLTAALMLITSCGTNTSLNIDSENTSAQTPVLSTAGETSKQAAKPEIGKNAVLSEDSLSGITLSLEINDIIELPSEEKNRYLGKSIYLKLTDGQGKTVTAPMPGVTTNGSYYSGKKEITPQCAENSTKLFQVEQDGKKHYIAMQYTSYDPETERYSAVFISCDMDNYEDGGSGLKYYSLKNPYSAAMESTGIIEVSDSFEYTEGTKFTDSELQFYIKFNTEDRTGRIISTDPDSQEAVAEKWLELYHSLEDNTDLDNEIREVTAGELKTLDFIDCSVVALDNWGVKIYERFSEEKTEEFIKFLTEADISPKEYEGQLPIFTGGSNCPFQITLNTGEIIHIGTSYADGEHMVVINGSHGYVCSEEITGKLIEYERESYEKYLSLAEAEGLTVIR